MRIKNQKGISLISLIITIIVIIILAAIVFFSGFGTTESAQFAKFIDNFSSYQEEIHQRYLDEKVQGIGKKKKNRAIYAEIAGGIEQEISYVLDNKELSQNLSGTVCYKLSSDRRFYEGDSGTYITDTGEIFTMPGYKYNVNGEERYYINSSKYYTGALSGGNTGGGGTSTGEIVEMTGAPTVDGTIAVGDYVEYLPDSGEYTNNEVPAGKLAKDYYLGHNDSGTITTDRTTKWRVVRINDSAGENGEILITPANAVNNETKLKLTGEPGYINSAKILDYVCEKLYSNSSLGAKARSMRVEDLDYNETGKVTSYAYYLNSTEEAPSKPNVTVNGVTYKGTRHGAANQGYTITFWEYDEETSEECIREKEIDGYTYRYATPTGDKPVLVSYRMRSGGPKYSEAMKKIGSTYGWLASVCTLLRTDGTRADFGVRCVNGTKMYYYYLAKSNGDLDDSSYGLRPIVTLGSGLHLSPNGQINGVTNWEISKVQ